MRTLGLIGGMSWESSALYYRLINEAVRDRLGGLRSASLLLYSYDFERIKSLQYEGRWDEAGEELAATAERLEQAGAEAIVICTNTMHKVAGHVLRRISIPLLDIADCTADRLLAAGICAVALLGTRFTMEQDFYRRRLEQRGLLVLVPDAAGIEMINRVIYDELCRGIVRDESRRAYVGEIDKLADGGAQAVILGCTEITLLIGAADSPLPTFDTTAIHAEAAADFAMEDELVSAGA
jgi:aspartate racemase